MREKTKLKTGEELPLEGLDSQVQDEGQSIMWYAYHMQQIINGESNIWPRKVFEGAIHHTLNACY